MTLNVFIQKLGRNPGSSAKKIYYYFCKKHSAAALITLSLVLPGAAISQSGDSILFAGNLKKMSLEELMNIEVTSVSKRPEKLYEVASAVQVITSEDIRNSGVKTLPEALRLANNLQVAQVNSSQWAISARGFNNVLANKLLVLVDGRTVYTPLYAGVFWDVQNLLLEDVERIEVISGPGGTMWGANAVNGVINIITKNSKDTQGFFAEGAAGNALPGLGSLRFGGKITDGLTCRVYGTKFKMGSVVEPNGSDSKDAWSMSQGGFRMDWEASERDHVSLQGNIYSGDPNPDADSLPVIAKGDNALLRWNHNIGEKSDFQIQAYYDHTWRDFRNNFTEDLKTYDIDGQHRVQMGERNTLTYGMNFRMMDHEVTNLPGFGFFPGHKTLYIYSLFLQDEFMLIKERLRLTGGIKIENNIYTNFQYQPNGRLTWTPGKRHTIWGAASRAVRNPSRIDRDFSLSVAIPNTPLVYSVISGTSTFVSETVIAYEAGWRLQPTKKLSISLSTFFNTYDNIRSASPGIIFVSPLITFSNNVRGETYGLELAANAQLTSWWNLRAGYTHLKKSLWVKDSKVDLNGASAESNDPENQFLIQSSMNLPGRIELGTVVRYVDILARPQSYVMDYMGLDVRLAWKIIKNIEISVVGQNLLDEQHPEFIASTPPRQIPRSVYGKIIIRL
jgi:iron complex outermembrane recepter protein